METNSNHQSTFNDSKDNDIECLQISDKLKTLLKSAFNIHTIGDLLSIPCKQLYDAIEASDYRIYSNHLLLRDYKMELSRSVHMTGNILKDEYNEIGLDEHTALTPIKELDLSKALEHCLCRGNIHTLGELLTYDYTELKKVRGMGEKKFQALKESVHGWGYKLFNEELSLDKKRGMMREQKQILLEDLGVPVSICTVLYNNGIFTIQDLKEFGPTVFSLPGFGRVKIQTLVKAMESLGIKFELNGTTSVKTESSDNEPTIYTIHQANSDNQAIQDRIKRKEELLRQYQSIMEERSRLLAKEKELDGLIQEMYGMKTRGPQNVKK